MCELENTIWVARTLFKKGMVTGSTGNISFRDDDIIYVSKSGSCFGLIDEDSFAKISLSGEILQGKPSKEWPMHLRLYQIDDKVKGVVHTHSFNSTLVSCIENIENKTNELLKYTPYLNMQTNGKIGIVDYANPGSQQLFDNFNSVANSDTNTYVLKNHGIFASADSILKAFYIVEEFEQSAKILLSIKKNIKFSPID